MQLSLFGMPYGARNYRDGVDLCVQNGLSLIELFNRWEFNLNQPRETLLNNAREWKHYADKNGIRVSCFSVYANVIGEQRETTIAQLKTAADICHIVESPYLHHTLAPDLFPEEAPEQAFELAVSAIREICDYAATLGITCLYEPQGFIFNGCEMLERLFAAVDREIGMVLDMGNPLFVDESAEALIERMGSHIRYVHLKDYRIKDEALNAGWFPTKHSRYLYDMVIGHGDVPLGAMMKRLVQLGYDGVYALECGGMESAHPAWIAVNIENVQHLYAQACR